MHLIVIAGVLLLIYGIYRLIMWGTSAPPTDQTPYFNPITGMGDSFLGDNDRKILGPSDEDIEISNRYSD